MKPKISLITCSYWRPDLLRRAILSVQKQTLQDYEHIIVSDHCPFTKLVCDEFADDKRIRFIEVTEPYIYNLGAVPFNLGIASAKADIICYLLDDDIIYEQHLEHHYRHYIDNPTASTHHTRWNAAVIDEPGNTVLNICSKNVAAIEQCMKFQVSADWLDVCAISHIRGIGVDWIPQSRLKRSWEDNRFIGDIGIKKFNDGGRHKSESTALKISWGGIARKNTRGVDKAYYDALMSKLVVDKTESSGYSVIDSTPYVYNNLKDTLYE